MPRALLSNPLRKLIREFSSKYRRQLSITYILTLTENLCYVSFPSLTGMAADGFLRSNPWNAMPLVGMWLLRLVVGNARHVYDTSVFTAIYGDVATDLVARQRDASNNRSQIIARVSLSRELVSFFESQLPAIASALVKLVGALFMMAAYDWTIAAFAIAILTPILISSRNFGRKSRRLNKALNNRIEREPMIVSMSDIAGVMRHFKRLRFWHLGVSWEQARTWTVSEFLVLLLVIWTLIRLTDGQLVSTGQIYAVLAYVWSFHQCVDDLPNIVDNVSRIQDISERIAAREKLTVDHAGSRSLNRL